MMVLAHFFEQNSNEYYLVPRVNLLGFVQFFYCLLFFFFFKRLQVLAAVATEKNNHRSSFLTSIC